jgi:hypothetical protein
MLRLVRLIFKHEELPLYCTKKLQLLPELLSLHQRWVAYRYHMVRQQLGTFCPDTA